MPLPPFTYLSPASLDEACRMLAEHGDAALPMAGGTDLLIKLSRTGRAPRFVVGLRRIAGLAELAFDRAGGLRIGALALLSAVAEHEAVRAHFPALAYAASATATVQVRNLGTVVGNLCNASPSADTATPLLAYGAELLVRGAQGERVLALDKFFLAPGKTALVRGELVCAVRVPTPPARSGSSYQRISERSQVDIAAVGVSAQVTLEGSGRCQSARLALGAVAPTPLRVPEAEQFLAGKLLDDAALTRAGQLCCEVARPISDARAGAAWRKRMVDVLTRRALLEAARAAGSRA